MRASTLGLALSLLAAIFATAPTLSAQEHPFELSVVLEPGGSYSDYEGFDLDLGYGVGLGWAFSDAWSAELRWLGRESDSRFSDLDLDTYQLGVRRTFAAGSAWRPFVELGAHYQSAEIEFEVVCIDPIRDPCPPMRSSPEELGAFVGGGADWYFSRRAALRLDGRVAVYDSDSSGDTEDSIDLTAGIVLRF